MQLPFTIEQFLAIFVAYNTGIWPSQIVLNLLAFLSIGFCFRGNVPSRVISVVLGILWLWTGIVYHLMFFSSINPAAILFAALFILEAFVFVYAGVIKQELQFGFRVGWRPLLGGLFLAYGLFIYPVIGYFLGHEYPASPTFGAPCPTTIFTFGLLLWTIRPMKWYVVLIPFIWSCVGFMAALNLGIFEDVGLLVAGVVGSAVLLMSHNTGNRRAAA